MSDKKCASLTLNEIGNLPYYLYDHESVPVQKLREKRQHFVFTIFEYLGKMDIRPHCCFFTDSHDSLVVWCQTKRDADKLNAQNRIHLPFLKYPLTLRQSLTSSILSATRKQPLTMYVRDQPKPVAAALKEERKKKLTTFEMVAAQANLIHVTESSCVRTRRPPYHRAVVKQQRLSPHNRMGASKPALPSAAPTQSRSAMEDNDDNFCAVIGWNMDTLQSMFEKTVQEWQAAESCFYPSSLHTQHQQHRQAAAVNDGFESIIWY